MSGSRSRRSRRAASRTRSRRPSVTACSTIRRRPRASAATSSRSTPPTRTRCACLILALTDQFGAERQLRRRAREARGYIAQLSDEYERAYYTGIVFERETRAYLERKNVVRSAAYDGFRHAMEWYERAEQLRPPDTDDACCAGTAACARSSASGSSPKSAARAAARVAHLGERLAHQRRSSVATSSPSTATQDASNERVRARSASNASSFARP